MIYMDEIKAKIITSTELVKKGTEVKIIGTIGSKKYRVLDKKNVSYTVMKDSLEIEC